MRRLPIFFVLDVSESMAGDSLRQVSNGLEKLVNSLRRDPHALETVFLSLIVFGGKAKVISPLVELMSFYPPRLPVGAGTSLGAALDLLMNEIDRSVIKSTNEVKGDWKPIVYLFTDGKPTDETKTSINRWIANYSMRADMIAIGIGPFASMKTLRELTENAFHLINENEEDFVKFIKWMTLSVSTQSQSVQSTSGSGVSLAEFDESILKKIDLITQAITIDEDYVILTGKCEKTKLPYIMRYNRLPDAVLEAAKINISKQMFRLDGVFPLEADYFSLSDERALAQSINSNSLLGAPGCPHCGAPIGFAMCSCGGIHCLTNDEATCPWCATTASYSSGNGGDGFDVNRSRG
jgi:uncharacterized protein YegL